MPRFLSFFKEVRRTPPNLLDPCACERTSRCIDYVYYYPDQIMPDSGGCGLGACGGDMSGTELSAESDFNRTFGIVDACTSATGEVRRKAASLIPLLQIDRKPMLVVTPYGFR